MSAHFHIPKVWPMLGLSTPGLPQYCPGPRHRQTVRAAAVSARSRRATTRPAPPRPGTPAPCRGYRRGADCRYREQEIFISSRGNGDIKSSVIPVDVCVVPISGLCAEFPAVVTWGGAAAGAAGAGRRLPGKTRTER